MCVFVCVREKVHHHSNSLHDRKCCFTSCWYHKSNLFLHWLLSDPTLNATYKNQEMCLQSKMRFPKGKAAEICIIQIRGIVCYALSHNYNFHFSPGLSCRFALKLQIVKLTCANITARHFTSSVFVSHVTLRVSFVYHKTHVLDTFQSTLQNSYTLSSRNGLCYVIYSKSKCYCSDLMSSHSSHLSIDLVSDVSNKMKN